MPVEIVVPLGFMATIVLFVWFSHASRVKTKDRQAQVLQQVIDKFSTGEAFAEAIKGPGGEMLVRALAMEDDHLRKRIWPGLLIPASILTLLGIGFFVLWLVKYDTFLTPAVVVGAVGLGLAFATYVLWRIEEQGGDEASEEGVDPSQSGHALQGKDSL